MELLDRLRLPSIANGGALAFNDGEREAVDERHDIRDDVLLRPEHLVLSGNDPFVAVLPSSSVGDVTLRRYGALSYRQNSARDLRCALNGA